MDPEVMRRRLLLCADKLPRELAKTDKRKMGMGIKLVVGVVPMALPLIQDQIAKATAESLLSLTTSFEAMLTVIGSNDISDEQFLVMMLGVIEGTKGPLEPALTLKGNHRND